MAKVRLGDLPASRDGNGYVTINGTVHPAFKIAKITPRVETTKEGKQFLEERVEQNAVRGMKHAFDMDYYMASSAMLQAVKEYEDGGDYPDISIQYFSATKAAGRQEVLLTGVILDSIGMGALDDSTESAQTHSSAGSFADFEIISKFKE